MPVGSVTAVVDFGSSHTVTVLSSPGRAPRLVTVDGQPWLPSAAFLSRDDQFIVGADALRLAAAEPARLETSVKSRIDEREVLLGDTVLPVATIIRAVLNRAVRAASTLADEPIQHLVLTYPADWSDARLGVLTAAGQGLAPLVSATAAPVGAAAWFATMAELPVGALLGVLDVGGGTCGVAVVRRVAGGFEIVGSGEIPDLGGADFDQRIIDHLKATVPGLAAHLTAVGVSELASEPLTQGRVGGPGRATPDQLRALVAFRRDVRQAKELLSRHPRVEVALPAGLPDALLTRQELAELLTADLDRITAFALRTIVGCDVEPSDLRAIQLVGGSARIPLLARLLGDVLDVPIQLDDQPEAVVAFGAGALAVEQAAPELSSSASPASAAAPADPAPARPNRRRRRAVLALLVAVLLLAATVLAGFVLRDDPMRGAAGMADNQLTLPPPAPGTELVRPGAVGQGLVPGQLGVPVRVNDGTTDVDWTVQAVVDPATDALTAVGATDPTEAARWVLVDTLLKARKAAAAPYYTQATYLVDDRGLLLRPSTDQPLPATCPFENPPTLRAGERLRQCFAFLVPASTPINAVVISALGASGGDPIGAVIPAGVPAPKPVTALAGGTPLGAVRILRVGESAVRVAVVDVVTTPSAYFDVAQLRRPGGRGVMVRAVVTSELDVDLAKLAGTLVLYDDRLAGSPVSGYSAKNGCTQPTDAAGKGVVARGRSVLCALFEVPSGVTPDSVRVSGTGGDQRVWRLR